MTVQTDSYNFKAEIKQLLQILVHSLYKDRDIFLRELISNASDALTRLHFEMLTNRDVLDADAELAIHIDVPEVEEGEAKKIIIKDSGIGMTRDELIHNLGTIAQSGAREFLSKIGAEEMDPSDVIGQFGVGFYSVFMVADEVRVVSRSYQKDAEAAAWISDGSESFHVEAADKADRGTELHITLKKDAEEFATEWKLRQIIKKHSDFVRFPVYVGEEQANQQESLWRKRPSDVTDDDYKNFYRQMTMEFEEPLLTIHFAADVPVNVRAVLFIPAKREPGILAARKDPGVMLYSHNVLIQEYCTDLLPNWLGFIDGVVDSEDLPLNVSRESVQNNRIMANLGSTIRKRILRELNKLAEEDAEKYEAFWQEFGRAFKEGVATDPTAKEDVLPFFRYYSSKADGLTSLDEYIGRMAEGQDAIYYVLGEDRRSVAHSPHLDPFKARDLEVLYWVDPLDSLIAPAMLEYKEKPFKNIDDAGLELPELEEEEKEEDEETAVPEKDFNLFVGRCVTTLGERVVEVRASKVLKDSPVRLVSPKDAQNREMHRIYRYLDQNYEVPKKILEVNRHHPLIASLARLINEEPDSPVINMSIEQLYDSALVQEGLHPNPVQMLPRIQELMMLAAQSMKRE
ncbi:MAG: molecular chaperone HtpG [Anaerolineales bacterium]|nr:molecular chaperone HtpG [Anaerolineales bacterium]MCB8967299.1 molecular chaperone HtpG [Ardenticatenaceae bacterium]